jgi:hypothetical protein
MKAPLNYADLTALAKKLKRPIKTLIVLDAGNDPFLADSRGLRDGPGRLARAEWFVEHWRRLNIPLGAHQRRCHYIFVSQRTPIVMLNGDAYENTLKHLHELNNACRDARTLGLMPAGAIIDKRRQSIRTFLVEPKDAWYGWSGTVDLDDIALPESAPIPGVTLHAPVVPQPYHIELWAEKSTVDDVLVPLGEQYNVNVVSGAGESTSFACHDLVTRAIESGRPVRILFISDFDPAGLSMPVAAARKIEHEIYRRSPDLDVQVRPVVLTHDQCVEYQLPRTPLKEGEVRKEHFEARFGEGATELDALEALHPGLLHQILVAEINRYCDSALAGDVQNVAGEIESEISDIGEAILAEHEDEVTQIESEYQDIRRRLGDWRERARALYEKIEAEIEDGIPDLDQVEWPEGGEGDEDPDPLFDSRRNYVEQIDRYKRFQGKPTGRQPYGSSGSRLSHRRRTQSPKADKPDAGAAA